MSSFQFPANPSDGDIVVRGNLQAFYNAATNTWRVSEVPTAPGIPGPPGPPGPIGPPGQGVAISGSVDTFANLPEPNTAQFNFWIVDDTNTLYYSDGTQWIDFGSPIQGPQGEPGEKGTNGTNGQNGRGWYDTNIINDGTEYKIQFLSNDGLGFTTDNLKGEKGETGSLQVATATTLGGIKIGRGLSVTPDGTLNAGQAYVDIETTPLPADGSFVKVFEPIYFDFVGQQETITLQTGDRLNWKTATASCSFPAGANRAMVYWFNPSQLFPINQDAVYVNDVVVYRGYCSSYLRCAEGQFAGNATEMFNITRHNLTLNYNRGISIIDRWSNINATKLDELFVPLGTTTLNWSLQVDVNFLKGSLSAGSGRVVLLPFRDADGQAEVDGAAAVTVQERAARVPMDMSERADDYPSTLPDELIKLAEGTDLRYAVKTALSDIEINLTNPLLSAAQIQQLEALRTELFNFRNLPGTAEQLNTELLNIINQVEAITYYTFRFEQ